MKKKYWTVNRSLRLRDAHRCFWKHSSRSSASSPRKAQQNMQAPFSLADDGHVTAWAPTKVSVCWIDRRDGANVSNELTTYTFEAVSKSSRIFLC